jgi:hypothetical protein
MGSEPTQRAIIDHQKLENHVVQLNHRETAPVIFRSLAASVYLQRTPPERFPRNG